TTKKNPFTRENISTQVFNDFENKLTENTIALSLPNTTLMELINYKFPSSLQNLHILKKQIKNPPGLKVLDLFDNKITNLKGVPQFLEELYLGSNKITSLHLNLLRNYI